MSQLPRASSDSLRSSMQREWVNRIKGTFALDRVERRERWQRLHPGM